VILGEIFDLVNAGGQCRDQTTDVVPVNDPISTRTDRVQDAPMHDLLAKPNVTVGLGKSPISCLTPKAMNR